MDQELLVFWIDQLKELLPDPCEDEIEVEAGEAARDTRL
jgi:hypothetical protein